MAIGGFDDLVPLKLDQYPHRIADVIEVFNYQYDL
jgi:hypothetical protein